MVSSLKFGFMRCGSRDPYYGTTARFAEQHVDEAASWLESQVSLGLCFPYNVSL